MTSRAEAIAERILHVEPGMRRGELLEILAGLSTAEAEALIYDWRLWSREEQRAPQGDWVTWLFKAGRGAGKTRSAAEWIRERVEGGAKRITLVGATAGDVRDIMVEGDGGLLSVFPPSERPNYEPSKLRLTFHTGARATLRSADRPERLRGLQHDTLWADELGAWRYGAEAWDMLMFGLRLGSDPRAMVSTTPKPRRIIRDLVASETCVVTEGSTYDNLANLAPQFVSQIIARYEGTRLGRQEIWAELLEEVPGALWHRRDLDERRLRKARGPMARVVVAIDPPGTSDEEGSAEAGLVVAGLGEDGDAYVLDDRSKIASPGEWAREALAAYEHWKADLIVAEVNFGGEMVEHTLMVEDPRVPVKVLHASRGKRARAEPVANLFDPAKKYPPRAWLIGSFPELEDQMCNFTGEGTEDSPDRLDAMVWAITELLLEGPEGEQVYEYDDPVRISKY